MKEEPWLWRRYLADGVVLGRLVFTHVIPLLVLPQWHRLRYRTSRTDFTIERSEERDRVTLAISGIRHHAEPRESGPPPCGSSGRPEKDVVINLSRNPPDRCPFYRLPAGVRKAPEGEAAAERLYLTAVPRPIERLFRLNGFTFLLCNR